MAVNLPDRLRRADDGEFTEVVYRAMECVFAIHNEFGRLFEEGIYKRELARRLPGIRLEVPVEVVFEPFRKLYFLDLLVSDCAVLEFKAVETLTNRHRAQLLQYLLLCDLPHGKLVNVRPERVEHEFVNCRVPRSERTRFQTDRSRWQDLDSTGLRPWLTALIEDLGTGLDVSLYEEAVTQFLGGPEQVDHSIDVVASGAVLGQQLLKIVQPGVAWKVTTLNGNLMSFETHTRKLLSHTRLEAIQWINIARQQVTFTTLHAAGRNDRKM
jgi:GxxExxY protein